MTSLSFIEGVKDRASRLLPNAFTDIVNEATSDLLLTPDWDKMMRVCDHANVPQSASDVVQAVRNRIDGSPKVQILTLVLIETLVKNCGRTVHHDLGEKKGLLRDIVAICTRDATRDVERDARSAALQLVMNLSHWFSLDTDPKLSHLAQLANNARTAGANFVDVQPDTTVTLRDYVSPPQYLTNDMYEYSNTHSREQRRQQQRHRVDRQQGQHTSGGTGGGRGRGQPHTQRGIPEFVVDAIPIEMPEDAVLANMMDTVMFFAELLAQAEAPSGATAAGADGGGGGGGDESEVLQGVAQQVQSDHSRMFRLVACEAPMEGRDALAVVTDSQEAVLQRFEALRSHSGAQRAAAVPQQSAADSTSPHPHSSHPQPPPPPPQPPAHDVIPDVTVVPESAAAYQLPKTPQESTQGVAPGMGSGREIQTTIPTIDELFHQLPSAGADATAAAAAAAFGAQAPSAGPSPTAIRAGDPTPALAVADDSDPPSPPPPPPPSHPVTVTTADARSSPTPQQQQQRQSFPAPAQAMDPKSGPSAQEMARTDGQCTASPPGVEAGTGGAAEITTINGDAPPAAAAGADEDFDAFLNERLALS